MADLSAQAPGEGAELTFQAADSAGDTFANDGRNYLLVQNNGSSSHTVTPTLRDSQTNTPGYGDLSRTAPSISVAAGETAQVGPLPRKAFNDTSGRAEVTYDAAGDLTVAAVRPLRVG